MAKRPTNSKNTPGGVKKAGAPRAAPPKPGAKPAAKPAVPKKLAAPKGAGVPKKVAAAKKPGVKKPPAARAAAGAGAKKPAPAAAKKTTSGSGGARGLTVALRSGRGRTTASQTWLRRQLNDPYVAAAQAQGWRSRAAFKLIEMDDRYKLIKPGMRVLDLGAAPGGWCQVAKKRGAGQVVALDLLPIDPIPGVTLLQGDFNDPDMPDRLMALMGGPPDIVLSDMAPNTTGHNATDHLRIIALAELALDFAIRVLAPGGAFVAKVFQGGSEKQMLEPMKQAFATVRHAKPPASRKESSELYVIATGFRGRSE
jgi:23S rRNA (uridine2552-2'-O)-methyltransferase